MSSEIIVNEETIIKTIDNISNGISNMNDLKKIIENTNNNLSLAWQSKSGQSFSKEGQNILSDFEKDIEGLKNLKEDLKVVLEQFTALDLHISDSIQNS